MTHYQTLSLPQNATLKEIKTAYRKLCLETHPDLHSCSRKAERFKRINEAYAVLSCHIQRRGYDAELRDGAHGLRNAVRAARNRGASAPAAGGASFGYTLPRNILIGSLLGITAATIYNYTKSPKTASANRDAENVGKSKLVEAYYNPRSGRYEKPKPWDGEYQRLNPEIVLVRREEVFDKR